MDSRDGPVVYSVKRVQMHVQIPPELKYLVICYQNSSRIVSFNMAVQRLLETHPALAQLAATLYTEGKASNGLDPDHRPPPETST